MSRFESFLSEQFEAYIAYRSTWAMTPKACSGCCEPSTATCLKKSPHRPI